jgi:hypothetical protein
MKLLHTAMSSLFVYPIRREACEYDATVAVRFKKTANPLKP